MWLITIISSVICKHNIVNIKSCFNLWSKTKKNLMGSWWNKLFHHPPRLKFLLSRLHTGCNSCFGTNHFARINPNNWGQNSPPSWASFTTWQMPLHLSKLTAGNVYTGFVKLICINCWLHSLWYKSHKIYRKTTLIVCDFELSNIIYYLLETSQICYNFVPGLIETADSYTSYW